jgi:hypothetical protein
MSLESIVEIAKLESADETETVTPAIENEITEEFEEKVISLDIKEKKGKGRPNIHPIEGRTYLLQSEVVKAFADPQTFAQKLQSMHAIDAARLKQFEDNNIEVGPAKWIDFTLHGPTEVVMNLTSTILGLYPGVEHKIRLSKSAIVSPSNALYIKPTTETIAFKGKQQTRVTFKEFSPDNVYVYISIANK